MLQIMQNDRLSQFYRQPSNSIFQLLQLFVTLDFIVLGVGTVRDIKSFKGGRFPALVLTPV